MCSRRYIELVVTVVVAGANATWARPLSGDENALLKVPRSTNRYSPFSVQCGAIGVSMPPPAVQPTLFWLKLAATDGPVANNVSPVTVRLCSTRPHATPPVAY